MDSELGPEVDLTGKYHCRVQGGVDRTQDRDYQSEGRRRGSERERCTPSTHIRVDSRRTERGEPGIYYGRTHL
jgi:hypothetical protein